MTITDDTTFIFIAFFTVFLTRGDSRDSSKVQGGTTHHTMAETTLKTFAPELQIMLCKNVSSEKTQVFVFYVRSKPNFIRQVFWLVYFYPLSQLLG